VNEALAPDVSVLVVSYNHVEWLRRCLQAVPHACAPRTFEILVVDNASRDGSREWLAAQPGLGRFLNQENAGFTRAMNQALGAARGRFVLWLNSDCEAGAGSIAGGIDYLTQHPEVWIVGGALVDDHGKRQPSALAFPGVVAVLTHCLGLKRWLRWKWLRGLAGAGARLTGSRYAASYLEHGAASESPRETDWVTGAFLLARREAVERVGGLDERFWMYSEDTDWCRRVKLAGGRVVFLPSMRAVHAVGASAGTSDVARCHYYRSMWLYHAKHDPQASLAHAILTVYFRMRALGPDPDLWRRLARWAGGRGPEPCAVPAPERNMAP
jgi:hypothetical protein